MEGGAATPSGHLPTVPCARPQGNFVRLSSFPHHISKFLIFSNFFENIFERKRAAAVRPNSGRRRKGEESLYL